MAKRFISKRNQVFIRDGVVVKRLASAEQAVEEAEILFRLYEAGVSVPRVMKQRHNEIIMEHVPGETIPDFLERMGKARDETLLLQAAQRLFLWFKNFYEAVGYEQTGEIRGDVNGRNFIIAENRVVSVDFEERAFGKAEQDIGRLLAFIRTYNMSYDMSKDLSLVSVKRHFSRLFESAVVEGLRLPAREIHRQYRLERIAMIRRRGHA
jgi:tRNA A-37 threonylcarbamoyl transferase component Bud32